MKKVLIIDNYDSFTYNLVHAIEGILGHDITIWRNDQIDYSQIEGFEYIILSPGPGIPNEAGDLKKVISDYSSSKKMLGVCLGHQAIGEVYGATIVNMDKVYHGVQTDIIHNKNNTLFQGLEERFDGGRYHSWVIKNDTLNEAIFEVTSRDDNGEIMSFKHKELPLYGVQFHPESILTPEGETILSNFLNV